MNLLQTEKLFKSFGNLVVTKNIDLVVREGERHALIGPNGAGKTSLVHQIAGQLRPTSGRVLLKGVDITGQTPDTDPATRFGGQNPELAEPAVSD